LHCFIGVQKSHAVRYGPALRLKMADSSAFIAIKEQISLAVAVGIMLVFRMIWKLVQVDLVCCYAGGRRGKGRFCWLMGFSWTIFTLAWCWWPTACRLRCMMVYERGTWHAVWTLFQNLAITIAVFILGYGFL
jgi:hypothetical protein